MSLTVVPTAPLPTADRRADSTPVPAVELRGVGKRYGRRGHPVLAGVSVSFAAGSLTAVMGLSGSGKSTLLHLAAGLDRPTTGSVHLAGVELTKLHKRALAIHRRRYVGFVFQSLNLVPTLTVAENIVLPLRLDHRTVRKQVVRDLAERVGVADMLRRLPHTLSGGQQQRVAIARALITAPDVVFADEPTAALDPYTTAEIRDLLRWAVDELGQTVVLVTHEPGLAGSADRALLLHRGEVVDDIPRPDAGDLAARLQRLGRS